MTRLALIAAAAFGVFTLAAPAVADEQSAMERARANPDAAFSLRLHLSSDARDACGVDTNQSRMSMRIWQLQHDCLRDYFIHEPR